MNQKSEFLPMTSGEMKSLGWNELDILLITGDAYVDHPSFGIAVIARVLEADGYRVGIIAQPDWKTSDAFKVLGRPRLFCGITGGNLDSMLANYTAARRKRKEDSYSENGKTGCRPNLATIVYTQRIKEAFPGLFVVIGGIEASLRRVAHYDYWQDRLKPTVLLDSKADILIYGMGEKAIREVAKRLSTDVRNLSGIGGTAILAGANVSFEDIITEKEYVVLPSYEDCLADKKKFLKMTKTVESELNPYSGKRLLQKYRERILIVEPPSIPPSEAEIDRIYGMPFTRKPHPEYLAEIPAFTMVKDSVTVVRGCAGGCSFCSLGFHQGKFISSRSRNSVKAELERSAKTKGFSGTISDLGGPTANLYGCKNGHSKSCITCRRPSCLFPSKCHNFLHNEKHILQLYRMTRRIESIKHVFIASGIRMDLAILMPLYMKELIRYHVSGHLKVAPEHLHPTVLKRMRKPSAETFFRFCEIFDNESKRAGKEQYIVPYFISSFPGCGENEMNVVETFLRKSRWKLQQVQDYIPLPMTPAAAMYYSGLDYHSEKPVYIARGLESRRKQLFKLQIERKPRKRRKNAT